MAAGGQSRTNSYGRLRRARGRLVTEVAFIVLGTLSVLRIVAVQLDITL